jgi:DNA polymerase-3 subunit delta
MLVFGDDLQMQEACKTIIDLLVPENQRGFNLERFDGRSAAWDEIEVSIATPPLFPGKKVLWIENAPYFFSGDQTGELGGKVLQLWNDGKRDEASRLLMDLLLIKGWTQEQWERLQPGASGALAQILENGNEETGDTAEALLAHCRSKRLELTQRRHAEGDRLHDLLDRGLPPWNFLLLTAVQVDRRTRLYKRLEEMGTVLNVSVERDRSGKISRESLIDFINQRVRQAGKTMTPRALEMILLRAGHELRGLGQELDKLLLYVGDRLSIREQDVEVIVADQGEGWIFDLTRAVAERDVTASLGQLARLLAQGEHPLKILSVVAGEVRKLMAARQLIDGELRGLWKRAMSYQQFQQNILGQGTPLLSRSPYADYMCFQRADNFSLSELAFYMERIFEADLRLKSTGSHPRLLLERLILGMCLTTRQSTPAQSGRAT